jgi:hypothetical protein
MNPIEEHIELLTRMATTADSIMQEIVKTQGEFIAELNRDQLAEGIAATGGDMPNYSAVSQSRYGKSGKIKLFDRGGFYRGIKPEFNASGFDMTSSDYKNNILNPFRKTIESLGLTEESMLRLRDKILPLILTKLRAL